MAQGTGTPKIVTHVSNGNLLRQIDSIDGIAGIVATSQKPDNIGIVKTVYSLRDAENKGYAEDIEPFIYGILKEFYNELGGSQEFWILGVEDTMTMTQMLTYTNSNGALKLLTESRGRVNLLGVLRKPSEAYDGGLEFLDNDVLTAVTTSKTLAEYQQSINRPVRFLIEGRVVDSSKPLKFFPNSAENGYSGVVLGSSVSGGTGAVALALARAVKYDAHIKIGSGSNGALSISSAFIGDRKIESFTPTELDNLADFGFILIYIREGISGFFFGRDNMCANDDFRILVHGRLIDKAQRIAAATTTSFLETSMRITTEGQVNDSDAVYLEQYLKSQILAQMESQISAVDVIIPTSQDLINTSTLEIQLKIQPLGYLTWIIVNLGLTKTI